MSELAVRLRSLAMLKLTQRQHLTFEHSDRERVILANADVADLALVHKLL